AHIGFAELRLALQGLERRAQPGLERFKHGASKTAISGWLCFTLVETRLKRRHLTGAVFCCAKHSHPPLATELDRWLRQQRNGPQRLMAVARHAAMRRISNFSGGERRL